MTTKPRARIRVHSARMSGILALDGQLVRFSLEVIRYENGAFRTHGEVDPKDLDGRPVDQFVVFRALDQWVEDNMSG